MCQHSADENGFNQVGTKMLNRHHDLTIILLITIPCDLYPVENSFRLSLDLVHIKYHIINHFCIIIEAKVRLRLK